VDAGGDATLRKGQTLERAGSFTDQGTDTWIGTVDCGDSAGPQPLALKGRRVTLHHTYREARTYHVVVSVRDGDGGVGAVSFDVAVR
jgi:PKD domain